MMFSPKALAARGKFSLNALSIGAIGYTIGSIWHYYSTKPVPSIKSKKSYLYSPYPSFYSRFLIREYIKTYKKSVKKSSIQILTQRSQVNKKINKRKLLIDKYFASLSPSVIDYEKTMVTGACEDAPLKYSIVSNLLWQQYFDTSIAHHKALLLYCSHERRYAQVLEELKFLGFSVYGENKGIYKKEKCKSNVLVYFVLKALQYMEKQESLLDENGFLQSKGLVICLNGDFWQQSSFPASKINELLDKIHTNNHKIIFLSKEERPTSGSSCLSGLESYHINYASLDYSSSYFLITLMCKFGLFYSRPKVRTQEELVRRKNKCYGFLLLQKLSQLAENHKIPLIFLEEVMRKIEKKSRHSRISNSYDHWPTWYATWKQNKKKWMSFYIKEEEWPKKNEVKKINSSKTSKEKHTRGKKKKFRGWHR